MRKTVMVTESVTRERQIDLVCDICGLSQKDWEDFDYNENEVTIEHRFGNAWPSGGSGKEIKLDVCPACFNDKILSYIISIAALPIEYTEWDF